MKRKTNLFKRLFGKQSAQPKTENSLAQIRDSFAHPFSDILGGYIALNHNLRMFKMIREAIPFINIGILKRTKLIGDYQFETYGNNALKEKLDDFKDKIRIINQLTSGLNTFIAENADSTFATGYCASEIVPTRTLSDVYGLKVANSEDITFMKNKETKQLELAMRSDIHWQPIPFENQDLINYLAFDQREGHPQGYSLLYALPFIAQVIITMEQSWKNATWRIGDPTYIGMVTAGDEGDDEEATSLKNSLAAQMKVAMKARNLGKTYDIFGSISKGGKVEIETLGADGDVLTNEIPVRTLFEQVIAEIDIPPHMLGVSWSARQTMAREQSDMLISNIKSERKKIKNNLVGRVIDTFLILTGDAGKKWDIIWDDVNLMDEENQAKAGLWDATRVLKVIEATVQLLEMGFTDPPGAEVYLQEEGVLKGKAPKGWYKSFQGRRMVEQMALSFYNERKNGKAKKIVFPVSVS